MTKPKSAFKAGTEKAKAAAVAKAPAAAQLAPRKQLHGDYVATCRMYSLTGLTLAAFHTLALPKGFYRVHISGVDAEKGRRVLTGRGPNGEWIEIPMGLVLISKSPNGEAVLEGEIYIYPTTVRLDTYWEKGYGGRSHAYLIASRDNETHIECSMPG